MLDNPFGIEIYQVEPQDDSIKAHWEAIGDNVNLFGVSALNEDLPEYQWSICVNAAEFVTEEPFKSRFLETIAESISAAKGVTAVEQADHDVWVAAGNPDGAKLIEGVVIALLAMAMEIGQFLPQE